MPPFFRKIRRDLLANSQFFKYLKYAIGEILLVVIGILIALQVNNWNEYRADSMNRFALEQSLILRERIREILEMVDAELARF